MRSRSSLTAFALAAALVLGGCVTVGPAGPGVPGSGTPNGPATEPGASSVAKPVESPAPDRTRRPRRSQAPTSAPPTAAPTDAPTMSPGATPTDTPTDAPTAPATEAPTPAATLNFSLPAVFGSTALSGGFVPDPFTVGVTGGGPADTSYLGGGCSGSTSTAPSFSVNYTAGAFPLLRFYFLGSGDTAMIINTPAGAYVCVDDSFGTTNPTIDFNTPTSGRYDVWIGTFAAGGSVPGTLHVTENSGNHP